MSFPLVSYIIVTMNRQEEVRRCLASIRDQAYPEKQIIVVDNGSSDSTVEHLREYFPEVAIIPLPTNQGVAGGRNRGIEAASGTICIFLDDDATFLSPHATHQAVAYFQADPELAGVAFLIRSAQTGVEEYKAIPRQDKRAFQEDYPCSYYCAAGFAMRRAVFDEVGLFWEQMTYGEELDFSYRLLEKGYRLLRSAAIEIAHAETPRARPPGQWIYMNARQRCWIAVKNLPWRYVISTTLLWWTYTAFVGLKTGQFRYCLRGLRDSLIGLPAILGERHPISKATVQRIKNLSGRLWY